MTVVRLRAAGVDRVLRGEKGMTFVVDSFTQGVEGRIAHVRDYRFPNNLRPWQIWSIPHYGYRIIGDDTNDS